MRTLISIRQLPYSEETLRFGSLVAKLEDASITLMKVIDSDASLESAQKDLNKAVSMLEAEPVSTKIRKGQVLAEILKETRENEYDLLVIGSRDVAGLRDTFLRTLTGKLAEQASTSVLVVREHPKDLRKILISIGGQKMNKRVVRTGTSLARAANAAVTVLYVSPPVPSMYTGLEEMEETLEELLQTDTPIAKHLRWSAQYLAESGIESEIQIRRGIVADEIMREAMKGENDLVVIGAGSMEGSLKRLLMDKVTPQVVDRAPCSVLVVRRAKAGE